MGQRTREHELDLAPRPLPQEAPLDMDYRAAALADADLWTDCSPHIVQYIPPPDRVTTSRSVMLFGFEPEIRGQSRETYSPERPGLMLDFDTPSHSIGTDFGDAFLVKSCNLLALPAISVTQKCLDAVKNGEFTAPKTVAIGGERKPIQIREGIYPISEAIAKLRSFAVYQKTASVAQLRQPEGKVWPGALYRRWAIAKYRQSDKIKEAERESEAAFEGADEWETMTGHLPAKAGAGA